MTIPSFLILILVATTFRNVTLGVMEMGLIVAIVSWAGSARAIRAQVLTMRERPFVMMAKLSGMGSLEIVMKELVPNLLPFLVMSLSAVGLRRDHGLARPGSHRHRQPPRAHHGHDPLLCQLLLGFLARAVVVDPGAGGGHRADLDLPGVDLHRPG